MAERKFDLLQHSETQDHPNIKVLCLDGDNPGLLSGNPDAEFKDVSGPENVIPLSPQWLHSRVGETKEPRTPNSFIQTVSTDANLKEQWKGEGSLDKKDWRRTAPAESEGGRRWREEERENTAVGRRDRRKEGEKEVESRKIERRSENTSLREVADNKHPNSSDRWQDTAARDPAHEARRDRKWSTAWGPENNEKDIRREKRSEVDKEDAGLDKQPSFSNSRLVAADRESEKSSTDKWRPSRLRDKLKTQKDVGFLAGRGRGSGLPSSLSMRTPIGASTIANAFCYPRAKLLDIYRDCGTFSSLRGVADGFVEVSGVTCSQHFEPLAFVSPDSEEQAVLEDISKGKIAGGEAIRRTFTNTSGRVNIDGLGISDEILSKSNKKSACDESVSCVTDDSQLKVHEDVLPDLDESELVDPVSKEIAAGSKASYSVSTLYDFKDEIFIPKASAEARRATKSFEGTSEYPFVEEKTGDELCHENENVNSSGLGNSYDNLSMKGKASIAGGEMKSTKEIEVTSSELPIRLPSDASVLFDHKSFEGAPVERDFEDGELQKDGIKLGEQGFLLEELSLFYKDPQGDIQGPFLGIDIIQWFEQGFFGTDLLVCLSDAPEGTTFQPLGELILHLRHKAQPSHGSAFEDSEDTKGTSLRSGHDISSKKAGIIYEHNSTLNPEQNKTLSDFSEQANVGLTDRGLPFPDMLKGTKKNTFDHEEQHFLESATEKNAEILARIIRHGIPPGESIGNLERQRMSSLSRFDSDDGLVPWQSEANAFGSVWPQQEADQFIDIRSGLLDATVSSSISGHMLSMMSRMQSLPNNHQQDIFHSSNGASTSPPIDRAWSETFHRDAYSTNKIFNVASDPHRMTHPEQDLQRIERDNLLFHHQLEQQKQKQQQQQQQQQHHQQQMLMQRQLQSGAKLLDQGTISGMGHNFDPSLLQHHQPLQPSLQPRQQLPCSPMPPSAHVMDPISRLQLQHHHHQPQHHLQLQPHQQQPQHNLQLDHQRQSHQTGLDQLLSHQIYDPSYAQKHFPSGGSSIDQLILRQEGIRHESQPHHQSIRRQSNSMDSSLSLEHLLHQRRHELSANQFPLPSQRQFIDERRVSGVWAIDESGEFVQTQAPTLHPFDLYQSQQQILNSQPQHSQLLNFQSSNTLASTAEIKYPYLFERPEHHDHNSEGRSLHGMHDPNLLTFERPTDFSLLNMDFSHSLKQAQERRVQERYNVTRLAGQDEQFPSEVTYNSRPHPMAFHGIQSEVSNGIWDQPSITHSTDLHVQSPGYFMRQGQPFDFITESQGQKLHRVGLNWQPNEGSQEHVSSEDLHRRSLISTHTADLETRQSHGDSLHQKFSLRSGSSSVMPGNVLATSSEQSQCMWTAVNSTECISGCTYDSSDLISSQLFKNRRNEDLSEVLEDLAGNGVGSTYMASNSASEIQMGTGLSVDGGYDGMHSEAFIEEPFYSLNKNELQLSLQDSDSLGQSSRDDFESLEFKEAKKSKRRSSKARGAVKMTVVSSSDASSVSNLSTGAPELSQNQQTIKHDNSTVQELSSWSTDFNRRGLSVHSATDTKKSLQKTGQLVIESNNADGRMSHSSDNGDQLSTVERENSKFSAKAFELSDLASSPLSTVQRKLQSNRRASYDAGESITENDGGNIAVKPSESAFQRKENLPISNISKTSAFNDPDTWNEGAKSFLNTLKNPKKPEPEKEKSKVDSSAMLDSDSQGSKSTKKKGKKGRQIDPSLLGFKVTSNRINMGEIQHPDD